jgi:hypothetical protein
MAPPTRKTGGHPWERQREDVGPAVVTMAAKLGLTHDARCRGALAPHGS